MKIKKLITNRFSVRSFTDQPIERQTILKILETARFAPSAVNFQPWHFIVVSDAEKLSALHKVYHRNWFREAPACIVVCADHQQSWKRRSDGKDFADVDAAIVADHLILKATEMGLGTCWVCNFDVDMARKILQTPEHIEPLVIVPLGYTTAEPQPKVRKPLAETVHWQSF
jgi:nitroreductase